MRLLLGIQESLEYPVKMRRLGPWQVGSVGLGLMNVSWKGRPGTDPELRYSHAIAGIHAALDAGVTLLDSANVYAPTWDQVGHNEILLREALDSWNGPTSVLENLVIATKGGIARSDGEVWGRDGSLDGLLAAIDHSIQMLQVERIQLYQHHRLDPSVALETQIENLGELKTRGLTEQIGVSNYSAEHLRVAIDILGGPEDGGVVSVQNQFSPAYRNDVDVFEVCAEHGIAFLPWSPLGGAKKAQKLISGEVGAFAEMAGEMGVSAPRLVLAWLLHFSPNLVALPGATRPETVADSAAAADLELGTDEMARIASSLPESLDLDSLLLPYPPRRDG